MSVTASSLIALVEARGAKEAAGQLLEVGAASDTAGTRIKNLATGGLLVAGAALVGIGVASTKMAGAFESSTNLLITSANEVPGNIDLIRKGLLQMSVDTATPVDDLEKGMFNVESASYHGAAAILVEKAAAEGAKVENADLAKVTDVLTTSMHNYNLPASQAVDVMNSFRMAASIGKMRMDDLTGALKNVLPIASQAGVKLTDVEAALSTMSLAGDKGASAGTHLQMMLTKLLAPTGQATSTLKEMGLTTQEISDEMKVSLPATVQMITDAVGQKFPVGSAKYIAALSSIVGGSKEMKAILELSGISLKTFTDDAAQLGPTMTANSTAVDGWNTVQSNFNFKMQAAKDAVDALLITLGTKLLPIVGKVADAVTPLITGFSDWITKSDGLSGAIDEVSSAFQQVFEPVQKVQQATKPLVDTFDRATAVLPKTTEATKPLVDTFDRATAVIKKTTDSVNPLVAIFKDWKPVIEDVFKDVKTLAGDVGTFVTGIVDAADKSGLLQADLQFLHDMLPAVGTFLVSVGDDVNQNLLPPIESLITTVGRAEAGFIDWADKSGAARTAIDILGGAVHATTVVVGGLIQGTSDLIGWFAQGGVQTQVLAGVVVGLGASFAAIKIADTVSGFQQMFAKLQEGDGIISNLADKFSNYLAKAVDNFLATQAPNLKASMDGIKTSAAEAVVAEEEVAAAPAEGGAVGWFAKLEGSLVGVETQAATTGAAVEAIGTDADIAAVQVTASTTTMDTELAGVETAAAGASTGVKGLGIAALTAGGPFVVLGAIAVGTYELIADGALNFDKTVTTSTGQTVQAQQIRYRQLADGAKASGQEISTAADNMKTAVMTDAQKMAKAIVDAGNEMATKTLASLEILDSQGVSDATKFSAGVIRVFNEMKTSGISDLSQLDGSAKSYLAEIQGYVDAMNGELHLASDNINARKNPTGAGLNQKNRYASGTDYAPGGPALVGEAGMELVIGPHAGYLPRGSKVIPNDQIMHGNSGWGGGGGKITVEIPVVIDGKKFAAVTVDDIMELAMRKTRGRYGRKVF